MYPSSYALLLQEHRLKEEEERKRKEEERLEEVRRRLEEEQKRLEEECRRKEEEEHARRLREREEQERLETIRREEEDKRKAEIALLDHSEANSDSLPASATVDISRGKEDELQVSQHPASSGDLDNEITDVLFHFDTIVSELERDSGASEVETAEKSDIDDRQVQIGTDQSNGEIQSDQLSGINNAQPSIPKKENVANLADKFSKAAASTTADEARSKSPTELELPVKANIEELKQQFLTLSPSKSQSRSPSPGKDTETLSKSGNVKNIIAQMQITRQSQSPPPSTETQEGDETTTVVKRQRERSPSIYKRITLITQDLEETEKRQSKSYTPPVVIKKVRSPFFSQVVEASTATPSRPVSKRMSQANILDSRVTELKRHVTEAESHVTVPESPVTEAESHVTVPESHVTEPESHVTEPESHVTEPVNEGNLVKSLTAEHETRTHKQVSVPETAAKVQTEPVVKDQSSEALSTEKGTSPEVDISAAEELLLVTVAKQSIAEPPEPKQPPVDLTSPAEIVEPIAIIEPASEEVKPEETKTEMQSSSLGVHEASEIFYRVRSVCPELCVCVVGSFI